MSISEKLSFVIPCYRSEDTIEAVVRDIDETVRQRPGYDYEVILVNDCSPDNTYEVLMRLADINPRVRVVNLARNFGQASAIMAIKKPKIVAIRRGLTEKAVKPSSHSEKSLPMV